jgi:uncharacterized protein YecT (DUF1311 family)
MRNFLLTTLALFYYSASYSLPYEYELDREHDALPSFNCYKASTEIEKQICENGWVSALDSVLSVYYEEALKTEFRDDVKSSQKAWMKSRNLCTEKYQQEQMSSPLQQCYSERIDEIKRQYGINQTREILEKISLKLGILLYLPTTSNAEKFIALENFSEYVGGLGESLCSYNPREIYLETDYMLKTRSQGSIRCGGTSFPIFSIATYCRTENGSFIPGSFWSCFAGTDNTKLIIKILEENSYSRFSRTIKSDSSRHIKNGENLLLQFFYSDAIHSIASKYMFSKSFLEIYSNSRNTIHSIVNYDIRDYRQILMGMQCTYDMIHSNPEWQKIFESSISLLPESLNRRNWYGKQFKGCTEYNINISGEYYTQKELYVLFWKLFFDNQATKYAKQILDSEIGMLPAPVPHKPEPKPVATQKSKCVSAGGMLTYCSQD